MLGGWLYQEFCDNSLPIVIFLQLLNISLTPVSKRLVNLEYLLACISALLLRLLLLSMTFYYLID